MIAVAPLVWAVLFEAALKSRMYSGYAPCVAEFHVRLRGPDISGGMVRGGREPLLSVVFGLLLSEHRAFCLFIVPCQAGKMGREGVFVLRDMLTGVDLSSADRQLRFLALSVVAMQYPTKYSFVLLVICYIPCKSIIPERIQVIPEECSPDHMSRDK